MSFPKPSENQTGRRRFASRRELLFLGILLLAAVLVLAGLRLAAKPGVQALVTIGYGADAREERLSLAEDRIVHIDGGALPVTLEIRGGGIRFINAVCPDHDCERFGTLRNLGDWAACLPAGVSVRIVET